MGKVRYRIKMGGKRTKKKHPTGKPFGPFGRKTKAGDPVYGIDPDTGKKVKVGVIKHPPRKGHSAVIDMSARAVPKDMTKAHRKGETFPASYRKFGGKKYRLAFTLAEGPPRLPSTAAKTVIKEGKKVAGPPRKRPYKGYRTRHEKVMSDPNVSVRSVPDKKAKEVHVYLRRKGKSKLWR